MDFSNFEMIDLILLDIEMPRISGIELSREIRKKTKKLIFTTAHTRYGYEAFEADADAYLLKPYSLSKFAATITKLFPEEIIQPDHVKTTSDFFFVKNKEDNLKMVKIKYGDIIAIESKQNYVLIHTQHKKILAYMSLKEIARMVDLPNFAQFQRSFILCKDHIDYIYGNTIKMINGLEITVGEYYRKDFTAFMSAKLIKAGRKN